MSDAIGVSKVDSARGATLVDTDKADPLRLTPQATPSRRGRRGESNRLQLGMLLFALPALAFYTFVVLVPSVRGAVYSFTDWSGQGSDFDFVGLQQYIRVFADPASFGALWHTVALAIGITIAQTGIGLLLALGVHSGIRSGGHLRVVFFAPAVVAPIASSYLWQYMFAPNGPLNAVLSAVGLPKLDWLGDPSVVLSSIAIVMVWQFSGYSMVIFLAGLEGVPPEQIEAAMLDGAGAARRFWYVVRPLLAPAFIVNLMISLIGGLKLFDQVYILTGGGPGDASQTMSTLIYKNAFQFGEFAYSIATAVILTLLVALLSGVQYFGLTRKGRNA